MQTNGQNYDLMPEDIVAWLREFEKDQPFIITGAGFDFVSGKFTAQIARPAALARRMIKFCSDLNEGGDGTAQALADELRKSPAFFFWWD